MLEPDVETHDLWAELNFGTCPLCGSQRLVPAVPGWEDARFCLDCKVLVEAPDAA